MILTKKHRIILFVVLSFIYILFFSIYNVRALDLGTPYSLNLYTKYSGGSFSNESGYSGFETTQLTKFKISDDYNTEQDYEYNIVANYSGQANIRAKVFVSRTLDYYRPETNHYFVYSVYSRIQLTNVQYFVGGYYGSNIDVDCSISESVSNSDSPHYFYNFNCNTKNTNRAIYYIGIRFDNFNDVLYSPVVFGITNFNSFDNETAANTFFQGLVNTTDNLSNEDVNNIDNVVRDILGVLSDDTIDNSGISSNISSWGSQMASNGVITNLITLPIQLLQSIVTGVQSTCTTFVLGSLYGTTLSLPCIDLSRFLGTTLFNSIDIIISGFIIYAISKKFVKIFNDFTNLKSNQIDELYGGGR